MTNEPKVYVIDCVVHEFDFREREFQGDYEAIMAKAEELGTVYSLCGFQEALNNEELNLNNAFVYISNIKMLE